MKFIQIIIESILSSPAFQAWFNGSKIVDAEGNPQVLYHGTRAEIESFNASGSGEFGPGVYLTDNPGTAHFYAEHVAKGEGHPSIMPVYASIKNPFRVTKLRWIKMTENQTPRTVQRRLIKKGHDGIIGVGINGVDEQIVAFSPTQIKSAISNKGTFDPENPSISN